MNDIQLYELCKKYGRNALEFRRKFIGLLPEVFKRRLFEKKGFSSIYEFAAKLAGLSHEQVDLAIRLERKFEDKPVLKKALVEGEVSINKLIRVASIATEGNQEELFEKTKILSNRAIETFVQDVKNESRNGIRKPLFATKSLHVHTLKLDEDVENELIEMQEKGININELLRTFLQKRKEEIEKKKEEIVEEQNEKMEVNKSETGGIEKERTRYMSVKIRKVIREEHGTRCSYPNCTKLAKSLHHTQRFALTNIHYPQFIAPLCEAHHEIAHKIDVKYAEISDNFSK